MVVLTSDLSFPVRVDAAMASAGWPGGQGITWVASGSDDFTCTFSDGHHAPFLLWGSNEESDQLIAYTGNQPRYRFGVACMGTWIIATSTFERYTLQSRLAPPLVENTFTPGTQLWYSLRGYFTPQDEWDISGDPRAPNVFAIGTIIQSPNPQNDYYLMLQTVI